MIYLLLSILFSTGLFIIFKYFGIFKVDILKAIFVNYRGKKFFGNGFVFRPGGVLYLGFCGFEKNSAGLVLLSAPAKFRRIGAWGTGT